MKTFFKMAVLWSFALSLVIPNTAVAEEQGAPTGADTHEHECAKDVELTKKQKKKLAELYDKLYEDKKALIKTLTKYEVMSKEQKEKHIKWLKAHIKKAKKHPGCMCVNDREDSDRDKKESWGD